MLPGNPLKVIKPLEHILTFVQTYCPYRERRTSWRSFSQDWPDNRAEPAEDSRERVSSPTGLQFDQTTIYTGEEAISA